MAGVTNVAVTRCKEPIFGGLVGATAEMPGFPGIQVADHFDFFGLKVSSGDVALHCGQAGRVVACLREGAKLFAMVEIWQHVAVVSEHSGRWAPTHARDVWEAGEVQLPIAWYSAGDDGSFVIVRV